MGDEPAVTVGTMGGSRVVAPRAGQWRVDIPEPGQEAAVWEGAAEVKAVWTGRAWMAANGKRVLRDVTHWRAW